MPVIAGYQRHRKPSMGPCPTSPIHHAGSRKIHRHRTARGWGGGWGGGGAGAIATDIDTRVATSRNVGPASSSGGRIETADVRGAIP